MSIRIRATIVTVILLTSCCIGLTMVLNRSALKMAEIVKMPLTSTLNMHEASQLMESMQTSNNVLDALISSNSIWSGKDQIEAQAISTSQAKSAYQVSSIMYMALFIIGGGFLTYFIMDKTLRPINELSNEMKNKSVENLSKEIELGNTKDEIYELTLSFNKMTKKLNEAFLMQKRFSNSAAHELRTPLAIMRTKLDVFKKRKSPSKEEYDNLIESMRNQLIRLSDIVNSLLSLTNMEDIDLSQNIHLNSLIKSVSNDLYSMAESKNIEINIGGEDTSIKGNYDLIYRAFYNLIENSIKYNYENGSININIEQGNKVSVIIKDTGIGIPNNMKEQVFEAFFTVNKSRSRKLGGAGIGLSIVKSIIDSHKGSIEISDNEDGGSIFTIKI